VDPAEGHVALQFVVLGFVSVALNTLADIVVAFAASGIREGAVARPALIRRLREASGAAMMALGIGLALAKRPANEANMVCKILRPAPMESAGAVGPG
jgi:threonine/homoserine/homoserine lactone efflux protein